jgi:hypothetical protein
MGTAIVIAAAAAVGDQKHAQIAERRYTAVMLMIDAIAMRASCSVFIIREFGTATSNVG